MQSKPEICHVINEWHNQCGGQLSGRGSTSAPDLFACGGDLETNLALLKGFIESQCVGVWSIPNLNVAAKSLWAILKWEKTPPNPRQSQIDAQAAEEKRRAEDAQRRGDEDQISVVSECGDSRGIVFRGSSGPGRGYSDGRRGTYAAGARYGEC